MNMQRNVHTHEGRGSDRSVPAECPPLLGCPFSAPHALVRGGGFWSHLCWESSGERAELGSCGCVYHQDVVRVSGLCPHTRASRVFYVIPNRAISTNAMGLAVHRTLPVPH